MLEEAPMHSGDVGHANFLFARHTHHFVSAKCAAIAALALLICAPTARATPINIDSFAQPDPCSYLSLDSGNNPSLATSQLTNSALGGQRDSLIQVFGFAEPFAAVGLLGFDTSYSIPGMQLSTNGLAPTVTTLQYSGINNSNTATALNNAHNLANGLGIDLSDGGTNDRFEIQFYSVDALPTSGLDLAVTITSPGGLSSSTTVIVPSSQAEQVVDIPFSKLVGAASVTDVNSVTFVFNGQNHTANVDFGVQRLIATVPEPTSATLLVTAAVALGLAAYLKRCRVVGASHREIAPLKLKSLNVGQSR
jgi:hypothetical protein